METASFMAESSPLPSFRYNLLSSGPQPTSDGGNLLEEDPLVPSQGGPTTSYGRRSLVSQPSFLIVPYSDYVPFRVFGVIAEFLASMVVVFLSFVMEPDQIHWSSFPAISFLLCGAFQYILTPLDVGYVNPALVFGGFLAHKIEAYHALALVLAELLGGFTGASLAYLAHGMFRSFSSPLNPSWGVGAFFFPKHNLTGGTTHPIPTPPHRFTHKLPLPSSSAYSYPISKTSSLISSFSRLLFTSAAPPPNTSHSTRLSLSQSSPIVLKQILITEAIFSSALVLADLLLKQPSCKRKSARGIIVTLVGLSAWASASPISHTPLNPLIPFGCDLLQASITGDFDIQRFAVYMLAPMAGTAIAFVLSAGSRHFLWAEFIGTFFVCFSICCVFTLQTEEIYIAFATATAYMSMLYVLGDVSGGYFNPAITSGAGFASRNHGSDCFIYILTQCTASIMAAFTAIEACGGDVVDVHEILDNSGSRQLVFLSIILSMTLMATYVLDFTKFFGNPPGYLIGLVYFANYMWSDGKSEINPGVILSLATTRVYMGNHIDIVNALSACLLPVGGCIFTMSLLKNSPGSSRLES